MNRTIGSLALYLSISVVASTPPAATGRVVALDAFAGLRLRRFAESEPPDQRGNQRQGEDDNTDHPASDGEVGGLTAMTGHAPEV